MRVAEWLRKRLPQPAVPRGTYTNWTWPDPPAVAGGDRGRPGGFSRFSHTVRPQVDPGEHTTYFWSHQFGLAGGEGGYLGLQTRGNRVDGSAGRMAIFSIWGAEAGDGPGAMRFSGEGSGWSCRMPYRWAAGHLYVLTVADAGGGWWEATVRDEEGGPEESIGRIRVPAHWGGLGTWSSMWTEYYGGAITRCRDLPYSDVVFGTPTADPGGVSPRGRENRLGTGTCDNSSVDDVDGGVRHRMGITGLQPS